jgi:WD40 repeat protein
MAFTPDGKILASGGWDHTVRLWDVAAGKELHRLEGHKAVVFSVATSPDGKTLASGGWDFNIRLWDVASGKETAVLKGHNRRVESLAFSPDGKTLASGADDNTARLWDVATGTEPRTLKGHAKAVCWVAFSPDGKTLASGSQDSVIHLWEVGTGQERQRPDGCEGQGPTFSPSGDTLISITGDNVVRFWDLAAGKQRRIFPGDEDSIEVFAVSPDGKLLAAGSRATIRLWEIATGKECLRFKAPSPVWVLRWSPNGRILASAHENTAILLWDRYGPLPEAAPRGDPDRELLYDELTTRDSLQAGRSMAQMVRAPEATLPLLQRRWRPTVPLGPRKIADLIVQLDDRDFPVRERAAAALEALGNRAEAPVRRALEGRPSLEQRQRLEAVLTTVTAYPCSEEELRTLRVVEVLEQIGTKEARDLLTIVSKEAGGRLSVDAKLALGRLQQIPDR